MPATTLRERLVRMAKRGLIDSRPHRLAMLGDIEAAAVRSRVQVEHRRSGPYDMLLRVSSDGTIGVVRQGPMLTAASLRYRIRTIERLSVSTRPMATLVLTDSEQDMRRTLRAIADPHDHQQTFVAVTGEVIAGKGESEVWQQGGYGFASAPTVMPNITLFEIVSRAHLSAEVFRGVNVGADVQSKQNVRACLPEPAEQHDQAPAVTLSRAEKSVLNLLADWPFCSPQQLAGLIGGVGAHRSNEVLRSLRQRGLVQQEPHGYVLTDRALTTLARRDRAAVGPTLDRWTAIRDDEGYIGSVLHTMSSQQRHQAGINDFCAMLSSEAARSPDNQALDLLPTHCSQLSYEHRGTRYPLYPDASFQLRAGEDWHWCLLELERRATTPKRVPERLRAYRRYFESTYVSPDHGGQLPYVLFVFETEAAEATFLDVANQVNPMPFLSSNTEALRNSGVLGRSWRA